MTDQPTCTAGCGRPSPDAMLCNRCAAQLERILAELPAHLAELEVTLTRQARTTRGGGGGKPTKAAESPLPYDVTASDLADRVRNGLSTWIRHVAENGSIPRHHGPMHPIGACQHDSCWEVRTGVPTIERTEDMAVWLVARVREIRQDEAAAELLADLKAIRAELRAAVDNRQYRYAGPCTATVQWREVVPEVAPGDVITATVTNLPPQPCGADLKARVGAHTIVCRDCGAEYDAAERADWIDKESAARLAPGPLIARALAESGYRVKPATIRKWAFNSRQWASAAVACSVATQAPLCLVDGVLQHERFPIVQAGIGADGLPLYVVGAVLTRVRADLALRREEVGTTLLHRCPSR